MLMFTVLSPNTAMLMISLVLYGLLGKMAVDPILISFVSEQASAKTLGRAFSLFNFFGMEFCGSCTDAHRLYFRPDRIERN